MLVNRSTTALGSTSSKQSQRTSVRVRAVEAPAKLSANDRVKLGDSDLEVTGVWSCCLWLAAAAGIINPQRRTSLLQQLHSVGYKLSTRNAHCAAAATKLWWQCCSALVHLTLHTAVPVSAVCCLGTMTWGKQNTEAEAHEQLSYAWDYGINFMDTAGWSHIPLLHCPVSVGMAGLLPGGVGLKRVSSVSS